MEKLSCDHDNAAYSSFNQLVERVGQVSQDESTSLKLLEKLILSQFINPITADQPFPVQETTHSSLFGFVPKKKRGTVSKNLPNYSPQQLQLQEEVPAKRRVLNSKRKFQEKEIIAKKIKKVTAGVELREKIETKGGSEIKLVIAKHLKNSDLDKGQNRLLMPMSKADDSFLKGEEKKAIAIKNGAVAVKFLEPCGEVSDLRLKIWDMTSSRNYVLISGWYNVVVRSENKEFGVFKEGNGIQVWSFRVDGQLWFTIEKAAGGDDGEN